MNRSESNKSHQFDRCRARRSSTAIGDGCVTYDSPKEEIVCYASEDSEEGNDFSEAKLDWSCQVPISGCYYHEAAGILRITPYKSRKERKSRATRNKISGFQCLSSETNEALNKKYESSGIKVTQGKMMKRVKVIKVCSVTFFMSFLVISMLSHMPEPLGGSDKVRNSSSEVSYGVEHGREIAFPLHERNIQGSIPEIPADGSMKKDMAIVSNSKKSYSSISNKIADQATTGKNSLRRPTMAYARTSRNQKAFFYRPSTIEMTSSDQVSTSKEAADSFTIDGLSFLRKGSEESVTGTFIPKPSHHFKENENSLDKSNNLELETESEIGILITTIGALVGLSVALILAVVTLLCSVEGMSLAR